jgi:RHS repeat-associated protein
MRSLFGARRLLPVAALLPLLLIVEATASADATVQAPELAAPKRGSLAGQYGGIAFATSALTRGTFTLPSPMTLPHERGALPVDILPIYSPESGISEWGLGWTANNLTITRWRASGDLDYVSDQLLSPWGRLVHGSDGFWYPDGLASHVRFEVSATRIVAYLPDGTRWIFGDANVINRVTGVYAWYLSEVDTVIGEQALLSYDANASGRRFLRSVSYGGRAGNPQYRVTLQYAPVPLLFFSYASGQELTLDRQISSVLVEALNTSTGQFAERWHYDLSYAQGATEPAFYLDSIKQTFASGESAPPVRYGYNHAADRWATVQFNAVPAADDLLNRFSASVIQPESSSTLDIDHDGRTDLEDHQRGTLLLQTDQGFQYQELPPPPPGAIPECRPADSIYNTPRTLAQMRAEDDSYQVLAFAPQGIGLATQLMLCSRDGAPLYTNTFDGMWTLGETVRLADVNRDHQPDLVRVDYGSYTILPNTSDSHGFAFDTPRTGTLAPAINPTAAWVYDFNGDGIADLIASDGSALTVWYGTGNFQFLSQGQTLTLHSADGTDFASLNGYKPTFLDANHDGLIDVLLSSSSGLYFFTNIGSELIETPLSALGWVDWQTSPPVALDLAGSGGVAIAVTRNGHVYSLPLEGPEVGLMAFADDGKGNVLRFGYGMSPAVPGTRDRHAVITQLDIASTGIETNTFKYAYQSPQIHSIGKFLIGFDEVDRSGASTTETALFINDDDNAGVPLSSLERDTLTPTVAHFAARQYDSVLIQGVPWLRLKSDRQGWQSADGVQTIADENDVLAYEADVCVAQQQHHGAQGTLLTQTVRANVPGLANHLHCLTASQTQTGQHADARLNFREEQHIERNDIGLIQKIIDIGPLGPLIRQQVTYNSDFTIASISSPASGTSTFSWDAGTRALNQVVSPDGSALVVSDRDPISGAIKSLSSARGTLSHTESFRYDGQERLLKQWDDLGHGSEANPNQLFSYRYATATQLGSISARTLMDASSGSAARAIELATATGESLTSAHLTPDSWTFDRIKTHAPARSEVNEWLRPGLAASADPTALDTSTLLSGAQLLAQHHDSSLGVTVDSMTRFGAGVARATQTSLILSSSGLQEKEVENGTLQTTHTLDAAKRMVGYDNQEAVHYGYQYDALGRLRVVALPDGTSQRVDFDEYGRDSRITRDGLGSIDNSYDAATGLLRTTRYSGADGVAVRAVTFGYDSIGRRVAEQHSDLIGGGTTTFAYYYDGATPSNPNGRTALGLLTAVVGDGFAKLLEYRGDGKLIRRTTELAGWRTVETQLEYADDGAARGRVTTVRGPDETVLSTAHLKDQYDAYGRVNALTFNDHPLAAMAYDVNGQLQSATFGDGGAVTFTYDPLTRVRVGSAQTTARWATQDAFAFNSRGLVGSELLSVGNQSVTRSYGYSAAGFLSSASDTQASYKYGYDGLGLPTQISDTDGDRSLLPNGSILTVGTAQYRFDALGRTVQRDDLQLTYGPDGQIARAQRGTQQWSFKYDEAGQRILKLVNGTPVAGYLDEGYLDSDALTEPFHIGSSVVGVIQNGAFRLVPMDIRGTVLGDSDGTAKLASPYGERATHPDLAAALDYVLKGYDADLGIVRMGVRDYDPRISRFWTPDALYLSKPESCAKSPVSCNLYSYANDNPLAFVDPSGNDPRELLGELNAFSERAAPVLNKAEHVANRYVLPASLAIGATAAVIFLGPEVLAPVLAMDSPWLTAGLFGAATNMAGSVSSQMIKDGKLSLVDTGIAGAFGFATGSISPLIRTTAGMMQLGAASNFTQTFLTTAADGKPQKWQDWTQAVISGALGGAASGTVSRLLTRVPTAYGGLLLPSTGLTANDVGNSLKLSGMIRNIAGSHLGNIDWTDLYHKFSGSPGSTPPKQ